MVAVYTYCMIELCEEVDVACEERGSKGAIGRKSSMLKACVHIRERDAKAK